MHIRDGRVSDEQVRSARNGTIVVGRGGWLRLPEDLLRGAGINDRASAALAPAGLLVTPAAGGPQRAAQPRPAVSDAPRMPPRTVVEARGLRRSFGSVAVLDGVSATFAAGRLAVVTGPSGSGKTTLLHLLAGLDLPDAGEVIVDGVALTRLDRSGRAELRRTRLAFVGQTVTLVPFLGARENVELALALRGVAPDEGRSRTADVLVAVGLEEEAERPVAELSAGQRERAAVARALAPRPLAVVADEPTARLDAPNALAVGTLFAELARSSGTAFVCATHDPLLIDLADDVLTLGSG
ncbi:MAG TPA: ATP-binding cassette domain-containing protein [Gaiellaceae bacterium]|nr:ATP-binding cassette domain-containing protein [Gaiellaceae bacterium]